MTVKTIFKYLFFATILALPFYIFRFKIGSIPSTLLEVLIYLTFITALLSGLKVENKKAVIWGGVFILAALLAVYFDPDMVRALGIWKGYFFDGYILFLIVLANGAELRRKIRKILVLSGAVTAVAALVLYFVRGGTTDSRLLDLDRLSPNYLAMFLLPIIFIGLICLVHQVKAKKISAVLILELLVMAVALVMTGSRGALIGGGGAVIIAAYKMMRRRTRANWLPKTILAFILIFFLGTTFYIFRPAANDLGRTGQSSNIRYYIWSASFEMARKEPVFGIGLSNYQDYFASLTQGRVNYPEFISPQALTAHNLYLHTYLTAGIIGLIAFIGLILTSRFWRFSDPAASLALVAILFYGLVDTPFFRNDLAGLFWIILALVYIGVGLPKPENT